MPQPRSRSLAVAGVAVLAACLVGAGPLTCDGFQATLTGDQEVDPVDTQATGKALLLYSEVAPPERVPEGVPHGGPLAGRAAEQIDFRISVSRTAPADGGEEGRVLAAHVRCAPAGENGPIAVTLFEANGAGVVTPAQLAGAITEDSIERNDCDVSSLADLVALLASGDAYVNVHTNAHPDGEIRGQVREVGGP
jgi:hypothetical protein